MKFKKIPEDAFQKLALNAGIILTNFYPEAQSFDRRSIIGATSGGVTITAVPSFIDFGEDIDSCKKNTKEMKRIVAYDITMSGTFVTVDERGAESLVGSCQKIVTDGALTTDTSLAPGKNYYTRSGAGTSASPYVFTPVEQPTVEALATYYEATSTQLIPTGKTIADDFKQIWFVGDYTAQIDGVNNNTFIACRLLNSFSTGGWSFVTVDMEKGKFAFEFTAHYSINNPELVPFEVYIADEVV